MPVNMLSKNQRSEIGQSLINDLQSDFCTKSPETSTSTDFCCLTDTEVLRKPVNSTF
jgi:hypothetical protein